jgi:hypothetical protein
MKIEWISVNVDKRLVQRIQKVVMSFSYKSVADFVEDAIRRRIEPLELELEIRETKLKRLEEKEE